MLTGILIKLIQAAAYYMRTFLLLLLVFFAPIGLFLSTVMTDTGQTWQMVLTAALIISAGWTAFSMSELAVFHEINREDLQGEDHIKTICYWLSMILIALMLSALSWIVIFFLLQVEFRLSPWLLLTLIGAVNALLFTGFRWKERIAYME